MVKTIRVVIDDEVHKQAKARAALEGITLAAWITAAINEHAAKPMKRSASTKKGGKPISQS